MSLSDLLGMVSADTAAMRSAKAAGRALTPTPHKPSQNNETLRGRSPRLALARRLASLEARGCKIWTTADLGRMRALIREGRTLREVSEALGRRPELVSAKVAVLRKAGEDLRFARQSPAPRSKPRVRSEPKWWVEARTLRARKLTLKAIGERLGRCESAVSRAVDPKARERHLQALAAWREVNAALREEAAQ